MVFCRFCPLILYTHHTASEPESSFIVCELQVFSCFSFTIEVWIKQSDGSAMGKEPILCTYNSSICLYLENNIVAAQVGDVVATGSSLLPEKTWHHLTLRYEFESRICWFINAEQTLY